MTTKHKNKHKTNKIYNKMLNKHREIDIKIMTILPLLKGVGLKSQVPRPLED